MTSPNIQMLKQTYKEDENYLILGFDEPEERSMSLIFRQDSLQWHIRVLFRGKNGITTRKNFLARRKAFEALISMIDFSSLPLLPDTVTKIVIRQWRPWLFFSCFRRLPVKSVDFSTTSEIGSISSSGLACQIRQDDSRVHYPCCGPYSDLLMARLSEIQFEEDIYGNVYRVVWNGEQYIYKTVDHPFYYPRCTKIFEEEVRYLRYCRGFPNVARLIGMVNSQNPFKTNIHEEGPYVITGMLLKYYPNGTLEDAIDSKDRRGLSQSWAKQLASALLTLHGVGITHLDIKPANVVFDATNEAVFIDIGTGYTYELLAPEIRHVVTPHKLPFEKRRQSDLWAFGLLMMEMTKLNEDSHIRETLQKLGKQLAHDDPKQRPTLSEIIHSLDV